ncbi:hypothetical protein DFH09DRAFT_912423, partial [Mycena vulgaris]
FNDSNLYVNWSSYDQLPFHPSFQPKAAWGVCDEFGALNHITNATLLSAKNKIKTGHAFNPTLELGMPDPPLNPSRPALTHAIQSSFHP